MMAENKGGETSPPKANPVAVQNGWLQRNQGKAITVRLLDGTRLSGLLVDWECTRWRSACRGARRWCS